MGFKTNDMKTTLSALLLISTFNSFSQIEATTNDGRKVALNKDGTWKYAKITIVEKASKDILENEALEFSMTIVRSLFERNHKVFIEALTKELFTFKEVMLITEEVTQEIKREIPRVIRDSTKTVANYKEDYNIEILTKVELINKITKEMKKEFKFPEHYKVIEGDLFFLGFQQIVKNPETNYIWDDYFTFMVRKVNGKWQIKGLLGG